MVWKSDAVFLRVQLKVYKNGSFSCQNGMARGKGLDVAVEPPRRKLSGGPPPHQGFDTINVYDFTQPLNTIIFTVT